MEKHFKDMSIPELIREEGYDCSCGRHHSCGLKYFKVGKGAVNALPEALAALGCKKPFVVMDRTTQKAAGDLVKGVLEANNIPYVPFVFYSPAQKMEPDEHAVGALAMAFDPSCDVLLAVGSGVINDCCKVVAHVAGKPSMVVCTAPSMDGYASNSSSMIKNRVKTSLYNACPRAIVADTDILRTAPDVMLQAGLGDMLAKYIAICEWRYSCFLHTDHYCEEIAGLMRSCVAKIVAHSDGLMKREDDALAAVLEGLVISGIAMAFAEISRPASGLEHYYSHIWEMKALQRGDDSDLHGIQVGVGTLLTLWLYENVLNIEKPDHDKAVAFINSFSQDHWKEEAKRIFGTSAGAILDIEEKAQKNSPERHAKRLAIIEEKWDYIKQIIKEELPTLASVHELMKKCGLPLTPGTMYVPVNAEDTRDALAGARDIRDKYQTCNLIWDLGLMEEAVAKMDQAVADLSK